MDVLLEELDNGAVVLLRETHRCPVVSIQAFVRTGSVYEGKFLGSGISHLFEHLLHGAATEKRSEEETRKLLESIGDATNAYTTKDHTCFFITTTKEHEKTAIELIADWLAHATISQESFERERGVIQREMEMCREDPETMAYECLQSTMFKVHPARFPVIGLEPIFRKLTREDVLRYYRETYVPNNVVFVVAGDIQAGETLRWVRHAFADFEARAISPRTLPPEPPQVAPRRTVKFMDVNLAYLMLGYRTVALTHPDLYALDVLSSILARGQSARLIRTLRDDKQVVYSITCWSDTPSYDAGSFVFSATVAPEKLQAAEQALKEEIARVRESLVSAEELARAKRQTVAENVFSRETVEEEAQRIGGDYLSTFDPYFSDRYVERIQSVTAGQVREVARRYFLDQAENVVVIRPQAKENARSRRRQNDVGRVSCHRLENGLVVLLKRDSGLPSVAMQAFFLAGLRAERKEQAGICRLTAATMMRGTKDRTAQQIADAFESRGGAIHMRSGRNTLYAMAECLSEDWPTLIDVFADVLRHPSFPIDEVERMRSLQLAQIRQQKDQPETEAALFFRKVFFGEHPYGRPVVGETATVESLTAEDVRAFWHDWIVPNNGVVAVYGDIQPEKALEKLEALFADWQAVKPPKVDSEAQPAFVSDRHEWQRTEKDVAIVWVGYPGVTFRDLDRRYAADVLDAIMTGHGYSGGWLFEDLRGRQLVYAVGGENWAGLEAGYFGFYAETQPSRASDALDGIDRAIARAVRGEISENELTRAKNICATAHALREQAKAEQAMAAALDELYGVGFGHASEYARQICAVSLAQVCELARETFSRHRVVAISGPEGTALP